MLLQKFELERQVMGANFRLDQVARGINVVSAMNSSQTFRGIF